MLANKTGIQLSKPEIAALLAFVGDDRLNSVHFRVTDAKLFACATNGKRAVECSASNDGGEVGEWIVDRTFLEAARRLLDADTCALLKVKRGQLRDIVVCGVETGDERERVTWPTDAASTQTSMDELRKALHTGELTGGSWFAIDHRHLAAVSAVAKACNDSPVTCYPPDSEMGMVGFETTHAGGTWCGKVSTTPVVAPGDEAETETEEPPPGEPTNGNGKGNVFKLEPSLQTAKTRRPKASKAKAKKTSKRRARAPEPGPEASA